MSLFEELGGAAIVDAMVDDFYDRVSADRRIAHFFVATDMPKLRNKQKAFLSYAFGGAPSYTGESIRVAHAPLIEAGLNDAHFDAVVEHMEAALAAQRVRPALVARAVALAESQRSDVLNRRRPPA